MLKLIKRKLNKSPIQNSSTIVKRIPKIDKSVLKPLLSSPYLGEGVYGFEIVSNSNFTETYLISPSVFKYELGEDVEACLKINGENLQCYSISLSKPSFLPLITDKSLSILNEMSKVSPMTLIQFLFTIRQDQWQQNFISQYADYLKGNDYPAESKFGRVIQNKTLNVLNKISGFRQNERNCIKEIEQKILDKGFRFEFRVITSEDCFTQIEHILRKLDFFNQLIPYKVNNKNEFLLNFTERMLSSISQNQLLSEKELISVVSDETIQSGKEEPSTIVESVEKIKEQVVNNPGNLVSILPIGVKKEREINSEIVNEIPYALKKAKVIKNQQINIQEVETGATVQRITFEIPKSLVYSDIKKKYEDIKAALAMDISIMQGKDPNTVTFIIPCKEREIIYLKELIENPDFIKFAEENPLPFVCGIDMFNQPVFKCLTKAPHLLIAGATNSGKSVMLNVLLMSLILFRTPNEVNLYLIDPKKNELTPYNGIAHVIDVIKDMDKAINLLNSLVDEMERRYDILSDANCRNIGSYNKQNKIKMPYIITAIDEYNDLRLQFPQVEIMIERLGQKARAAGIHLVICTQRPDKEVMSGVIKTNLPSRISFRLDNSSEYRTVFGTGIPFKLLGFGDGVVKFIGQMEEFIRFQAPVITLDENEEEKVFKEIKGLINQNNVNGLDIKENAQEEPLDRLKRIIATTGTVRVKNLQKEMGIRINVVSELMQQLVKEGWLEKPESKVKGYRLIANEEELEKWKMK